MLTTLEVYNNFKGSTFATLTGCFTDVDTLSVSEGTRLVAVIADNIPEISDYLQAAALARCVTHNQFSYGV